jgi:hypothetical protein
MQTYILSEGVLNDNLLLLPNDGKVFKGNFIAIVKEYFFANAWSNKEKVKKFRKHEQLQKYLKRYYPEFAY